MAKKKSKLRTDFRKKHESRTREKGFTKAYEAGDGDGDDSVHSERISGKGELTRKRTIIGAETTQDDTGHGVRLEIDETVCLPGRVLCSHGLTSEVEAADGAIFNCATRRLLKTLSTDQRHVVAAGDRVYFRPEGSDGGIIERVEPRHGVLSRTSKGRQHVIVTNIDQLLIVTSAAEPNLKPNLIDRFLITAEKIGARPVIVINKVDLVNRADFQPLAGVFGQMGYQVLFVSAQTGFGVEALRRMVTGRESVVAGQSGVGKSSILNCIDPGLELKVRAVSEENQKGRHTTTAARLIRLTQGGYIVDTPGIRQFQLWDVTREEVGGYYRDLRPYVNLCRFPDCTHTHEADCGVKNGVADGRLDARRYESYCQVFAGDEA
ncbi:MAG TPA: ribosome small subunit-dependent GTPase A [Pirellulaceae bacterium]|nr:ribosome small subunit-dependent GTPase A [Pirellulaceae bacterium]